MLLYILVYRFWGAILKIMPMMTYSSHSTRYACNAGCIQIAAGIENSYPDILHVLRGASQTLQTHVDAVELFEPLDTVCNLFWS